MELRFIILESLDATTEQKKSAKKIKKNFTKLKWQKGITDENDFFPELDVLYDYLLVVDAESATKKKVKSAKDELNKKVHAKYGELSEAEVKSLVVDDKWMSTLDTQVRSEMERISHRLTGRIKTLSERYQTPLPSLISKSEELRGKVESHLQQMGFNAAVISRTHTHSE
jgi:type I restriction enzyme M protein